MQQLDHLKSLVYFFETNNYFCVLRYLLQFLQLYSDFSFEQVDFFLRLKKSNLSLASKDLYSDPKWKQKIFQELLAMN